MCILLYTGCCVIKASLNRAAYVSLQLDTGNISKAEWELVTHSWQDSPSKGSKDSWIILVRRVTDGTKNNGKFRQKENTFNKFNNVWLMCLTFSLYHEAELSLMDGTLGSHRALRPRMQRKLSKALKSGGHDYVGKHLGRLYWFSFCECMPWIFRGKEDI